MAKNSENTGTANANAGTPSPVKLLTKISVAKIHGKIDPVKIPENGSLFVARIVGVVNGVKTGTSTYGPWVAFTGSFLATAADGTKYRAGKCFLPPVASNLVEGALMDPDVETLNAAFDVSVKRAETSVGYEYEVTPLLSENQADQLLALAGSITRELPALPAPK